MTTDPDTLDRVALDLDIGASGNGPVDVGWLHRNLGLLGVYDIQEWLEAYHGENRRTHAREHRA